VSHGFELDPGAPVGSLVPRNPLLAVLHQLLLAVNRLVLALSMVALVLGAAVLTSSVATRYFLHWSTDWQDEVAVFLLVGAVFMCCGYVQSLRGHVGIEALGGLLPAAVNRARLLFVDVASTLFCAFFTWKSWALLHEAWVEGQTTSSSFAPPLWIPYGLMTVGMGLLVLQLFLQSAVRLLGGERRAGDAA
jgi:TRAP-type C4-dicarboxylate transport system permease small subunit